MLTLLAQLAFLPRLASDGTARMSTLLEVTRRPGFAFGMLCTVLVFGGHFALFTYIRPYLEDVAHLGIDTLTLLLLAFGAANFAGTLIAGVLLERSLRLTLALMPLVIGSAALLLAIVPDGLPVSALLVVLWGMAFGGVPVGWSTWVARSVPDEAESAGGVLVAAVQLAIAAGAAAGGLVFDLTGIVGVFAGSGVLLVATAALIVSGVAHVGRAQEAGP